MRKKILTPLVLMLGIIACLLCCFIRRPYKHLSPSDVLSASVHLSPPDKTVLVTDVSDLVACLQDVVVFHKDNSYTEYVGQAVTFTMDMKNGAQEVITAYNPFVIINDTGYRTIYGPCEKLNNFGNRLLHDGEG